MTVGVEPCQADLFKGTGFVGDRVGERSVFSLLAREGPRLFPGGMFDDLFSSRGRRSVPPRVVATVMVRFILGFAQAQQLTHTCRVNFHRDHQFLGCGSASNLKYRSRSGADPHSTDSDLAREEPTISQTRQTRCLRVHQLRQLSDTNTPLHRQIQLGATRHPHPTQNAKSRLWSCSNR